MSPRKSTGNVLPKYFARRSTGVYCLRFDVPKRLFSVLKRTKITVTLGTADLEVALKRFKAQRLLLDQLIASAEQALAAEPPRLTVVQKQAVLRQMAELRLGELQANPPAKVWHPVHPSIRDEVIEAEGLEAADWQDGAEHLALVEGRRWLELSGDLKRLQLARDAGETGWQEEWPAMEAVLVDLACEAQQRLGRVFSEVDHPYLALAWVQAAALAAQMLSERSTDWAKFQQYVEALESLPPPAEVLPQQQGGSGEPEQRGATVEELVEGWAKARRPAPRQIRSARQVAAELIRSAGHNRAPEITADDVRKFRDLRLQTCKPQTTAGNLTRLRTIWRWAVMEELLPDGTDPFSRAIAGIQVKPGDVLERRPFSDEEIAVILREAAKLSSPAERWSWPVCLFTGLRPEEFACLRQKDFVRVDGIACVEIRHEAQPLGRAKTSSAERTIPVPEVLMQLGFWEWGATSRGWERGWLFKLTSTPTTPNRSNALQGQNSLSLRSWGITDERKVFYSARHTFAARASAAGVSDRLLQSLMGHSHRGSMTARYAGRPPIGQLKEAIDSIEWPGAAKN